MKQLVLVGGGHAHLLVLESLIKTRLLKQGGNTIAVSLVTPSIWQEYSGMLPGWISGFYDDATCRINLVSLAAQAGVNFIRETVKGMDAQQQAVYLSDGTPVTYDLLSLDIGSDSDLAELQPLGTKLLALRPIDEFRQNWKVTLDQWRSMVEFKLGVVGGGAAGVEIALAIKNKYSKAQVKLIAGANGILTDHSPGVRIKALDQLKLAGVEVINERAIGEADGLRLSNGNILAIDKVIAATGSKPSPWLKLSQLSLDSSGYVLVDQFQRSISHQNIFATGNVSARVDVDLPKSGVHAVRAGPILAHNLFADLQQKTLRIYKPKMRSLYLLSCGNGFAIASWGEWSVIGRWVWRLKDFIDRRFIRRFTKIK